ncbi:MAG TPA: hypothetical protein VK508_17240 [Cyclobacteriaceae bacterium]|nr:hypothetical protein [Cyclobacteriaceae bacterium]
MKKLLYSILIAFGVSACIENDIESPSTTSSPENLTTATGKTATGPGELGQRELAEIKALDKTPITQAEFDEIIANAPPDQPIVIKRRSGHTLQIGQPYAPPVHPELLHFEFVECEFEGGIIVQNTFQAILNIRRCVMQSVRFENNGVVQMMEIKRSKIEQLLTMEGGRVSDLTLTGTKIQTVTNDLGGMYGFQVIHF